VEPTVYAVLALLAGQESGAARRGIVWLRAAQRPDGSWPPQPGVDESTWVTALAALIPPDELGEASHARAIQWLAATAGEESTMPYRVRQWLLGQAPLSGQDPPGWPWVPGTAAWVAPTSFAILALEKECRRAPQPALQARIEAGRAFLLRRICQGGGWNHGGVQPLGYPSTAYPETTGLALAALRGVPGPKMQGSLALAHRFLAECRSADAWNWLRLGLLAQRQLPAALPVVSDLKRRTVPVIALDLLISHAIQTGRPVYGFA
jgi:hypothetical protein